MDLHTNIWWTAPSLKIDFSDQKNLKIKLLMKCLQTDIMCLNLSSLTVSLVVKIGILNVKFIFDIKSDWLLDKVF